MKRCILALGLVALMATGAFGQEIGPVPREVKTTFEIPYKLTDTKHVMVRVKLNGKGPFNFILDTGAPAMIMSETIAKKANAKLDAKNWGDFKLELEGGMVLPAAHGLATEMFQLKGMNAMGLAGVELHGVLGYNILAQFRIQYDFTAEKLVWTKLNFDPPKMVGLGKKADGGQGGLEMMGDLMKTLAPLLGMSPNFEIKPRGYLGMVAEEKNESLFVQTILPGSPAEAAGLQVGDEIKQIADGAKKSKLRSVDSMSDLLRVISKMTEGEKLLLQIKRGGESKDITLELGKGL